MIGTKIKDYILTELIEKGGMGDVYLGVHESLGRKVAIKMLNPVLAANEDLRNRFKEEALALSQFSSPLIVDIITISEQPEGIFLIMKYIDGITLDKYIANRKTPLNAEEVKSLFLQMLDAVDHIHNNGIEHRDIKPSNFMVNKSGIITLIDFGIAKRLDGRDHKLTKTGIQIGTPYYMSPEQIKTGLSDKLSDIYSLGVTLYEIASGKRPYPETLTEYELYKRIVEDSLPDLDNKIIFCNIIKKATEKLPIDRYQSITEFKKAFELVKEWDPSKTLPGISIINTQAKKLEKIADIPYISEPIIPKKKKTDENTFQKKITKSTINISLLVFFLVIAFISIIIGISYFTNVEETINNNEDGSNVNKNITTNKEHLMLKDVVNNDNNVAQNKNNLVDNNSKSDVESNNQNSETKNINSAYYIGQENEGGIIFYIDKTGKHGVVAAILDIGNFNWYDAFNKCHTRNENMFSDWRLPSKNELNLMYDNLHRKGKGNFSNQNYWSNDFYEENNAWVKNFSNGKLDYFSTSINTYNVRCVRDF